MRDEESLIRRAQERDQVALTQIYEENFDKIYRYIVLKIGDRAEAEDMTQQVFLNALKSIDRYKFRGMPFSAWLFRIAHNQVVDHYRKKSRSATVPLDENITSGKDNPGRDAERKMQIEEMNQATKQLTKAQQEVISLRLLIVNSTSFVSRNPARWICPSPRKEDVAERIILRSMPIIRASVKIKAARPKPIAIPAMNVRRLLRSRLRQANLKYIPRVLLFISVRMPGLQPGAASLP